MQDSYYSIEPAVSTFETGPVYPQGGISLQYNKRKMDSFTNLKSFQLPDFTPDFDHFVLNPKAKYTNLISGSIIHYGLLCNKELLDTILQFKIQENAVFKALIKKGNESKEYFWLHLGENDLLNTIDYRASQFYVKRSLIKKDSIQLSSYKDYWVKLREFNYKTIKHKSLTFLEKITFDLFVIPFFDGRIIISEKLKDAILKKKHTGINIKEVENFNLQEYN